MRSQLFALAIIFAATISAPTLRAQGADEPGNLFLSGYNLWESGKKAEPGSPQKAATSYRKALGVLTKIATQYPNWNPSVVQHRISEIQAGLARAEAAGAKPELDANSIEPGLPTNDPSMVLGAEFPPIEPPTDEPAAVVRPTGKGKPGKAPAASTPGEMFDAIQKQIADLNNELASTKDELAKQKAENEKLRGDYDKAIKDAEDATKKMIKAQTLADAAGERLASAEALGKKATAEAAAAKIELDKARAELDKSRAEATAADEVRSQLAGRLENLNSQRLASEKMSTEGARRMKELQNQLDKSAAEKRDLQTRLTKAEEQIKLVTAERDAARGELTKFREAQKQIDQILAERDKLRADLVNAEKSIANLRADGARKDEEIARLRGEVENVKKELTKAQKESAAYQQQMGEMKTKLENATKQLSENKQVNTKLLEENRLLFGIVTRQMKEQARRDETKKLVLGELKKLDLDSKALINQIEILSSPVVKLTRRELALFKSPNINIDDKTIEISASKEDPAEELPPTNLPGVDEPKAEPAKPEPVKTAKAEPGKTVEPPLPTNDTPAPVPTKTESTPPAPEANTVEAPAGVDSTLPGGGRTGVPSDLLPQAKEAKEHFEKGNYTESEKVYVRMLSKAPNNVYVLSNLGVVRFRANKLKLAEESFKKAIAIAADDDFSHCTLGIVYYSQSKFDEAVNSLTKALAINPKNATAHNYLGITAAQKGWVEAAFKSLQTAIDIDSNYADAHFNMAVLHATQTPPDKTKAKEHYNRARELGAEPDSSLEQLIK